MAMVSLASPRWRGECVPSFVCLYVQFVKALLKDADEMKPFLLFDRRLLPVRENFLLKFEVRLLSD